jgi:hypothetical protein
MWGCQQQHTALTNKSNGYEIWLCCREAQRQFRFYLAPGISNIGDYWTKHHCAAHHIDKCPTIILTPQSIGTALQASLHHNPPQLAAKAARAQQNDKTRSYERVC